MARVTINDNVVILVRKIKLSIWGTQSLRIIDNLVILVEKCNGPTWNLRPYSKSSLTLNEWRFILSFPCVPFPFLNS